ncbi:5-methyltetrahydropteroyltriglutamate--homocysteine methyltransferase [Brevibacillus reuszeri]|uniref:5-methyltetrahydropteroyltriglutamate-- homocysteine S-methyltransferase n=1 Tax=Brevibacillus reuszeri TaxID=54915 RepID=UPI001B231BBF|nr:5-methyltetrahydropteroyltriglutamate--homocysteine S-methyltransferase [Brevibacillus reuszeri]GIO08486.1 5-methyltetrahydropteroyltriglutamate--homocysteine methyltransferase [Brevibacillus reuszeri]
MKSSNLGYPRIGEQREWKKALESFWAGQLAESDLIKHMEQIRNRHLQKQQEKEIELIPVNDFTFYDHMLDMAVMFGLVPKRYDYDGGPVSLATYFAMARGNESAVAGEMTKWFTTNYHYIVPEFGDRQPAVTENKPLLAYLAAKESLGIQGKPVIVGPYTFVKLSKGYAPYDFHQTIEKMIPLYIQILHELELHGVEWVQIDEPAFVMEVPIHDIQVIKSVYEQLSQALPHLKLILQTYFEAVDWYEELVALPVEGIGLDLVQGAARNLAHLQTHGFPEDKVLAAGIIDGRNIWRSSLKEKWSLVKSITDIVPPERLWLQPSTSLLHVPVTVQQESDLEEEVKQAFAFADEKLGEVQHLVQGFRYGKYVISKQIAENESAIMRLQSSPARNRVEVKRALEKLDQSSAKREVPFHERQEIQQAAWNLPLLPTTTIGSFPQTTEVRKARQQYKTGEWSADQYASFIQEQIKEWIDIQEEIGLDVLVHGEFERNDMVEFFGEKLEGFVFTKNGWVQSYGSRCVKPPVIYGDVEFTSPMTVKESVYAKSLTQKPVKGMLTGPATILNWSFVRDDVSRKEVCEQIALALRKEVEALEAAGIHMIQVDEPALREGLPLKPEDREGYLDWAVNAFRIATSSVQPTTQIHTHMCYCEFHDFIDVISELDADVISIETSRSHGELVSVFETCTYDKGIGLGVYDIHSPRVPAVAEMEQMVSRALQVLPPSQFWINPDCGLKTRGIRETIASLKNMVEATHAVRDRLSRPKS